MNHPPISININESGDRLAVWYSTSHPENLEIKEDLKALGYSIETMGDVYTITGLGLSSIKIALEELYGVSEDDRSGKSPKAGDET